MPMPNSEEEIPKPRQGAGKKTITIIIIILFLCIIIIYWVLFLGPPTTPSGPVVNQTTYNSMAGMQSIISECISKKITNSDILPFLEDKIELCEPKGDRDVCELNYYMFNFFEGYYFNNCSDIGNQEAEVLCEAFSNKNISRCEMISAQEYKIGCKAIISEDISICDQITNEIDSKACKNVFHISKGVVSKDLGECENMQEIESEFVYKWFDSQRQWCRFIINKNASLYKQKLEECCNDEIIAMLNTSFCHILKSESEIQRCIERINGVFACPGEDNPKSCVSGIINLSIFCFLPEGEISKEDLYYDKYKFLKENTNICPSE